MTYMQCLKSHHTFVFEGVEKKEIDTYSLYDARANCDESLLKEYGNISKSMFEEEKENEEIRNFILHEVKNNGVEATRTSPVTVGYGRTSPFGVYEFFIEDNAVHYKIVDLWKNIILEAF